MTQVPSLAFERGEANRFIGAKVTVFVGGRVVTVERDDKPTIPWPGYWDLPGGGREGAESPFDCMAREAMEEVNLTISKTDLLWARAYNRQSETRWFFVARIPEARAKTMRLGDEGQQIRLMTPNAYLSDQMAVPDFQKRMADWIAGL